MTLIMNGLLTCRLVQELQQAAHSGRNVAPFVDSIQTATLPGALEYGCLRLHCSDLPPLPASVADTPLGQALAEVRSEVGLRADGEQKRPPRTMAAHAQEFIVLEGDDSTMHRDWREFLVRFRQSAKAGGFPHEKAQGIAAALGEMADNAVVHSRSRVGPLVGYQIVDGAVVCGVADAGVGILASLRENDAYRNLRTHSEAIRTAIQDGATRYGSGNGGFGFRGVFKALMEMYGTLRFRSGEGCLTMDGTDFDSDRGEECFVLDLPGFQVTICCRLSDREFSVPLV